jgi:beta-glucosidase-like glycosyl hydrolase
MQRLLYLIITLCLFLPPAAVARDNLQAQYRQAQCWVDSIMQTLSLRQRIAQLFVVPVNITGRYHAHLDAVGRLVEAEQVGGVIVMKAQPSSYAAAINGLQHRSRVPLLVSIDGEWGVGMRMDSVLNFPRQMLLGALQDNMLIEKMGEAIGEQCRRMGIHMNFAPVVDVNNNPGNPVINVRSFGEDRYNVAAKGKAYMQGMQNRGILACAKHFPGHGDTNQDSHEALPAIPHALQRLDSLELFPFKNLMENGVDAVMVAHLQIPAYDTLPRPSTLSPAVASRLVRDELEFGGLVITDALNMKGVTTTTHEDTIALFALLAGNDILLMPNNVPAAIDVIEQAVLEGKVPAYKVDIKCRKMLLAKYRAGLNDYQPVRETGLADDLNSAAHQALNSRLTEKALTLLQNRDNLLPLRRPDTLKIACLEIGEGDGLFFQRQLRAYAPVDVFSVRPGAGADTLPALQEQLAPYDLIIAAYHRTDARPQYDFGVDSLTAQFITNLSAHKKVILDFFGTPYGIKKFGYTQNLAALVVSYSNSPVAQERSAQLLFGSVAAQGRLPVSIDSLQVFGNGIQQAAPVRLHYVLPEEAGISGARLSIIDTLVMKAVKKRVTPGAQVLAIYKGQVFYNKSFGAQSSDTLPGFVAYGEGRSFCDSLVTLAAKGYAHNHGNYFKSLRRLDFSAGALCWKDTQRELTVIFLPSHSVLPGGKQTKKLRVFSKIFSEFKRTIDELRIKN